jgi:tetratricopeptide (TPR) repeat protein
VDGIAEREHRSVRRRELFSLGARHLSTSAVVRARRRGSAALRALLAVACVLGAETGPSLAADVETSLVAGDDAWSRRAEGAEGDRAAPGPIAEAIAAYEAALATDPRNLEALWKLERALHFQGTFTSMSDAERERVWERGTELAERSLEILHGGQGWEDREPAAIAATISDRGLGAAVHFFAAVHWGLWGETKGAMAAVRQGIAKRIRDHALIAIALDEAFERGAPRRFLGRLHAVAPRVPLFTGWVNRDEAIAQLERAVEIAPADLTNRLYLAEARLEHDPEHAAAARSEIAAVIAADPAADNLVEDRRTQVEARAALERAGSPSR